MTAKHYIDELECKHTTITDLTERDRDVIEACAKVCETNPSTWMLNSNGQRDCALTIRALTAADLPKPTPYTPEHLLEVAVNTLIPKDFNKSQALSELIYWLEKPDGFKRPEQRISEHDHDNTSADLPKREEQKAVARYAGVDMSRYTIEWLIEPNTEGMLPFEKLRALAYTERVPIGTLFYAAPVAPQSEPSPAQIEAGRDEWLTIKDQEPHNMSIDLIVTRIFRAMSGTAALPEKRTAAEMQADAADDAAMRTLIREKAERTAALPDRRELVEALEHVQVWMTGALVASCNCDTKTPDIECHDKACRYRQTATELEYIDAILAREGDRK